MVRKIPDNPTIAIPLSRFSENGQLSFNTNLTKSLRSTLSEIIRRVNTTATVSEAGIFDSVAAVSGEVIAADVDMITTSGFAAPGDGGGAQYFRVASEPTHGLKVQSLDGTWWEIISPVNGLDARTAGVLVDGTTDNATALELADAHGAERVLIASGIAVTAALPSTLEKRFDGDGHLKVNGQERGRTFSYIGQAMAVATATGWTNQFDGDNSHSPYQTDIQYENDTNNPFGASSAVIFDAAADVDPVTDNFTFTGHIFTAAQKVYLEDLGNTVPVPLVTDTFYYVIIVDVNTIQLAATAADAGTGTQINITADGVGNNSLMPTLYVYRAEITPFFAQMRVGADVGFNTAVSRNGPGRTGATVFRTKISHAGQGDAACYNATLFVSGAKTGATHFLANPAGAMFNGDIKAGAAGVYLQGSEMSFNDGGFDCAAIGAVINLGRSVASSALDTYWSGVRVQSIGAIAADDAFTAHGPFSAGLNLTRMTGTTPAGIALKDTQRVYWNATTSGQLQTTLGTSYTAYASSGLAFTIAGQDIVTMTTSELQVTPASGGVNTIKVFGGGTQYAHLGTISNSVYIGGGSTASDSVGLFFRTAVAGTEGNAMNLTASGHLNLMSSGAEYRHGAVKIAGARQTGWGVPTGTATRTTFATFGGQTITNPPTQAEVQAIDDAVVIVSERLRAVIDDLTTHGMIGA